MNLKKEIFGEIDGLKVYQFTLTNENDMSVKILNYGGIVTHLLVPDKNGKCEDLVLGYDSLQGYLDDTPYFGALVGRFGNRIANGKFKIEDQEYTLALNDGNNSLHGGIKGFDKAIWNAEDFIYPDSAGVILTHLSPDGDEGFPGNLDVKVCYTLTNNNELKIDYHATSDKTTIINLTHHSYFNLQGHSDQNVLGHQMQIFADQMVPVDDTLIPTGKLKPVKNTAMDFTSAHAIGERIDQVAGGYDHTWVLKNYDGENTHLAAKVTEPISGRVMEVYTDQPGIQFYSGNFLDDSITGKQGKTYGKHAGFCLETQHYPNSPNQENFPSVVLKPGEEYKTSTVYKFK